MFSGQILSRLPPFLSTSGRPQAPPAPAALKFPTSSLQVLLQFDESTPSVGWERQTRSNDVGGGSGGGGLDDYGVEEDRRISGITVPRQKYISVPKDEVLDALLSLFDSPQEVEEFSKLSACLDCILHAEHKGLLEELRLDYGLLSSCDSKSSSSRELEEDMQLIQKPSQDEAYGFETSEQNGTEINGHNFQIPFYNGLDFKSLFSTFSSNKRNSMQKPRVDVATRFQRAFMKLLRDAQFEELSAEDLLLTSALNTDYLLTLPIYVDWEKASESNAIIFRRGYTTERQRGFLIAEKLDYLQSKLLQLLFLGLSRPSKKFAIWIKEVVQSSSQADEVQKWTEKIKDWLYDHSFIQSLNSYPSNDSSSSDSELPIWLAAQRAIPRYEGFLSYMGPRERLWRKFLTWIGFIPSIPDASLDLGNDNKTLDPQLRPNRLPRISISDIWAPASSEFCNNNPWKMFRNAISIFFSQSYLEEPAFQELILLYTENMVQQVANDCLEGSSLQLKIYETIPVPDLPVIFPHKKLSFRILDTVRLDISSILGLLAFIVNYRFEDILSSPSAFLLDVIAVTALTVYVTRIVFGYKQTWDRYQLLVNKTLYEKTLASGFGSVHFLLDASEQQQYKEAILAYGLLLQEEKREVVSKKSIKVKCERFLYDKLKEKVEMPIGEAINTLLRLGLVKEVVLEGNMILQALPCSEACEALKRHWDSLLGQLTD